MAKKNLNQPDGGVGQMAQQIKDLQTANPLENGSVDNGTLTIRSSSDGLVIEAGGRFWAKAGAQMIIDAVLNANASANFAQQVVVDGNLFANAQLAVEGQTFLNALANIQQLNVVGTGTVNGKLQARGELQVLGTTNLGGRVNMDDVVSATGLTSAASPTSMSVLLVDEGGRFYRGPKYAAGGTGGSDNPTSPGGLGEGPSAPFSYQAFALGNGGGEADFGTRDTAKGWHDGLDFAYDGAGYGAAVRSVATGTVVNSSYANHSDAGPNPVCIDHGPLEAGSHAGKRLYSVYWHMLDRTVSVGDSVTADTVIGHVGAYGNVTGPHLHLELHLDSLHSNWPTLGLDSSTGAQDPVPIFNEYGGWR